MNKTEKVFPAPAGVILSLIARYAREKRFPRTCGGDPISHTLSVWDSVFSPHLRG